MFDLQPAHLMIIVASLLMLAIPVLLVAVGVYGGLLLFRRHPGQSASSPLDILKMRYAKGEITEDQFDKMKSDLS